MKEFPATITNKGQVTIPKDVRAQLGLDTHDKVIFVVEDDGRVLLTVPAYPTVASLVGAAGSLDHPLTWEEMRRIAYEDRLAEQRPGER